MCLIKKTVVINLMGNLIQGTIASDKVGYYTCFSTNKDAGMSKI